MPPTMFCGNCIIEEVGLAADLFDICFNDEKWDKYKMNCNKYVSKTGHKYKCPECGWFFRVYPISGTKSKFLIEFVAKNHEDFDVYGARRRLLTLRQIKISNSKRKGPPSNIIYNNADILKVISRGSIGA